MTVSPVVATLLAACGGLVSAAPRGGRVDASRPGSGEAATDDAASSDALAFDASSLSSCRACLSAACVDQYVQCELTTACYTSYACVAAGAGACGCAEEHDGGPYLALARCTEAAACGGACAALCGVDGGSVDGGSVDGGSVDGGGCLESYRVPACFGRGSSPAACVSCVTRACGGLTEACGEATDCEAFVTCVTLCSASDCVATCGAAHPAGQTAAEALDVCLGGTCEGDCS